MRGNLIWLFGLWLLLGNLYAQTMVGLSFDDPNTIDNHAAVWLERNQKILQTLAQHQLKAALFVCGKRVDSNAGRTLLKSWDQAGHMIANHSYSHPFFASSQQTAQSFESELMRTDSMIRSYTHFQAYFRFPYLKEGKTAEKRDSLREILAQHGYRNGHVGIDASDWYVDQLLMDSIAKNPMLNPLPFKEMYLTHLLERAQYYDSLSYELTGRKVRLVMLLHHNLINALFLDDLIRALTAQGFVLVDAEYAYQDPIYNLQSTALPAGESLIWSLAKATGLYDAQLRYPAEDAEYEAAKWQAIRAKWNLR